MKRTLAWATSSIALLASSAFAQNLQSPNENASHHHAMPGMVDAGAPTHARLHDGRFKKVANLQIETLISQRGIKMFVYDSAGQPVSVDQGRGAVSVKVEGNAKRYRYDLLPDGKGALTASVNLSQIAGRQIEVAVQLIGLDTFEGTLVRFTEVATVPASDQQLAAAAIARQKICPVSGKPLGSMGESVAIDVHGQKIFVCCAGCVKTVQAESAKYLAVVYPSDEQHIEDTHSVSEGTEMVRDGAFKVSNSDKPFIAAQKKCPVMHAQLEAMGGPFKVNAAGRAIYICCPGCAKKIAADPQKYLAVLKSQGVEAPAIK